MADKENNDGSSKSVKGLIESVGSIVNSINSLQVTKEASKNVSNLITSRILCVLSVQFQIPTGTTRAAQVRRPFTIRV